MIHFGSTFILCFLGFLFIQANAIPSWKSCTANSDCEATKEFCEVEEDPKTCVPCSSFEDRGGGSAESSLVKPTWCIGASNAITITSTSLLTFVKQAGDTNDSDKCPSFSACVINCRKEYLVEKSTNLITLTSTFADSACTCDKVSLTYETDSGGDSYYMSGGTNFGTATTKIMLFQESGTTLDLELTNEQPGTVDCSWEYSIGTVSSPPSPATTLTGLLGLISASVVAFALV
jgi:hypothetical protein